MPFNIKMFDSKSDIVAVASSAFGSIVPHSHEFVELVYVLSGKGENCIGEEHIEVSEGDVFIIADKTLSHSIVPLGNPDEFRIINVIFPFETYNINYSAFVSGNVYPHDLLPDAKSLFLSIKNEYDLKKPLYEEIMKSYTHVILYKLLRICSSKNRKTDKLNLRQKKDADYIKIAVEYICDNYDKQINVDDIASACGLCKAYLQRLFRKECDTSIKEYLIKYRIEQSCKYLLNTDFSVAAVAQTVGFNDLKYFYLKFKEIVGMTPINYKKAQEGEV